MVHISLSLKIKNNEEFKMKKHTFLLFFASFFSYGSILNHTAQDNIVPLCGINVVGVPFTGGTKTSILFNGETLSILSQSERVLSVDTISNKNGNVNLKFEGITTDNIEYINGNAITNDKLAYKIRDTATRNWVEVTESQNYSVLAGSQVSLIPRVYANKAELKSTSNAKVRSTLSITCN